jgi:hypothetical protein
MYWPYKYHAGLSKSKNKTRKAEAKSSAPSTGRIPLRTLVSRLTKVSRPANPLIVRTGNAASQVSKV